MVNTGGTRDDEEQDVDDMMSLQVSNAVNVLMGEDSVHRILIGILREMRRLSVAVEALSGGNTTAVPCNAPTMNANKVEVTAAFLMMYWDAVLGQWPVSTQNLPGEYVLDKAFVQGMVGGLCRAEPVVQLTCMRGISLGDFRSALSDVYRSQQGVRMTTITEVMKRFGIASEYLPRKYRMVTQSVLRLIVDDKALILEIGGEYSIPTMIEPVTPKKYTSLQSESEKRRDMVAAMVATYESSTVPAE